MCKHHFGYMECPRCHVLFGGIDVVERCAGTPEPVYGWEEQPSNLVFYPHPRKANRQTAFSTWHYKPKKPLGIVSRVLAYGEGTTVCKDCTQAERNNALREELMRNREATWPTEVSQEKDARIFEKSNLDRRLGEPRKVGALEVCKGWCRWRVKNYWKRRADGVRTAQATAKTLLGLGPPVSNGRF